MFLWGRCFEITEFRTVVVGLLRASGRLSDFSVRFRKRWRQLPRTAERTSCRPAVHLPEQLVHSLSVGWTDRITVVTRKRTALRPSAGLFSAVSASISACKISLFHLGVSHSIFQRFSALEDCLYHLGFENIQNIYITPNISDPLNFVTRRGRS